MSARMKKHHTDYVSVQIGNKRKRFFKVPKAKAEGILKLIEDFEEDSISWREAFSDLFEQSSESATVLRGSRLKAEMNQDEVAKKLGISQSYIAQLESGKKEVSKKLAIKFGELFNVDYRVFL